MPYFVSMQKDSRLESVPNVPSLIRSGIHTWVFHYGLGQNTPYHGTALCMASGIDLLGMTWEWRKARHREKMPDICLEKLGSGGKFLLHWKAPAAWNPAHWFCTSELRRWFTAEQGGGLSYTQHCGHLEEEAVVDGFCIRCQHSVSDLWPWSGKGFATPWVWGIGILDILRSCQQCAFTQHVLCSPHHRKEEKNVS